MAYFRRSAIRAIISARRQIVATGLLLAVSPVANAANLTVDLGGSAQVITFVGAIQRWDADGNHRRLPDPKAKIDAPAVDATATRGNGNQWVFKDLPKGQYDLVILDKDRLRIEGFTFVPIKEFDSFLSADAKVDEEAGRFILDDIKKSPHYENIIEPLYLAGDAKAVRVLMMLIRDKPTSYEADFAGAATMRHEVWQYSLNYGAWQKERRTKVLDRVLMHRDELRKWTWLWDAKLGGIEVADQPITLKYDLPNPRGEKTLKGLYPY
jgi:hypothetical protein